MKIIATARLHEDVDPELVRANQVAEAKATWDLYQADFLREFYFRADGPGVVLVVEAASIDEARNKLDDIPMVRVGVLDWELTPLRPFPVFAHLFGAGPGDPRASGEATAVPEAEAPK